MESADLHVEFIKNWFDFRLRDITNQAESRVNVEMLASLKRGLELSGKEASQYVTSDVWVQRVEHAYHGLARLMQNYSYIHDLFLIDDQENILFTVVEESDLGENLFRSPLAESRFAKSAKTSLKRGSIQFSDLERYASSNSKLFGFLTIPIQGEAGERIGVFAMQLRLDRIFDLVKRSVSETSSQVHYLVGRDGYLRTILAGNSEEVLQRVK